MHRCKACGLTYDAGECEVPEGASIYWEPRCPDCGTKITGKHDYQKYDMLGILIRNELWHNDELLKTSVRKEKPDDAPPLWGHCYVASEAYYHVKKDKRDLTPMTIDMDGTTHWYLRDNETGKYIDLTESQFDEPVPHEEGRGRGFPVPGEEPSNRTMELFEDMADGYREVIAQHE